MRFSWKTIAALVLAAGVLPLHGVAQDAVKAGAASSGAAAQMRFTYDNAQFDPVHYVIVVDENGRGHYRSQPLVKAPDPTSAEMPSQAHDMDIVVSPEAVEYLFAAARKRKFFAMQCEDGKGKVAFQGNKELAYQGPDGKGGCAYNWSSDDEIARVTRIFQGMSLSIEAGCRLAMEHRHDPLALDQELDELVTDYKAGRAAEIGIIAKELEAIAADDSVMDRARSRAAMLLRAPARVVE